MTYKFKTIISIAVLCIILINANCFVFAADYEDPFPLPELTGDWRIDYIEVAKSQLGYTEAEDGSSYFGAWADQTYRPWCSEFAAWCAEQAGIPETVIPIGLSTESYRDFFYDENRYYYIDEGIDAQNTEFMEGFTNVDTISFNDAEPGDIILKETNGYINDGPDHTGIFLNYENGEVEYISGNSSNNVEICKSTPDKFHGICKPDFEQKDIIDSEEISLEDNEPDSLDNQDSYSNKSDITTSEIVVSDIPVETTTEKETISNDV